MSTIVEALGPGLVTGASDDDPSGIATYASAGAALGFTCLWTALVSLPLMCAVQYICAKIGMVTGRGIAGVVRRHYSRALLYPVVALLFIANSINAGVDLGAAVEGLALIVPVPRGPTVIVLGLALLGLQVYASYRMIAKAFKWLTLALLAYIGAALFSRPDVGALVHGTLVPQITFDRKTIELLVAIFGTTLSPYLFFWQASQEVEEERAKGRSLEERKGATRSELRRAQIDVAVGMFFSTLVMYAILVASAATLNAQGITHVETAAQAAKALEPVAGSAAKLLMALGLIGTGVLAVPILTGSAAYALSEACGWRCSLEDKPGRAKWFYASIALSMAVGFTVNFAGISPVKLLVWTAQLNGVIAAPLLIVIMLISGNKKIMGRHVHGPAIGFLGWATTALMCASAIALLWFVVKA